MAMTLDSMTSMATLSRNIASSSNVGTDPITQAIGAASKRIAQQISSTDVQLSSYGQIKSGFTSVQASGKALSSLSKDATASDVSKAAQNFVNAFNTTATAVSSAINGNGKTAGALSNDNLARIASNDLRRTSMSGTGVADLQKIGISIGQNGTLSVDVKALESATKANPDAVKSTLTKLGQQASATATQELSSNGAVGSAVNSLSNRSRVLATQQKQQDNLAAISQSAIQQNLSLSTNASNVSAGISAYMKMFSL